MRTRSFAVALLAGIAGLTGCGSEGSTPNDGAGGPKQSASRDCFGAWNAQSNRGNQAVVAGRFTIARVSNWSAMASGGPGTGTTDDQGQGCSYLFHTSDRYLTISGAWEGETIRWGVPPTIHGSWSAEQQASGEDNARVDSEGRLSEQ